MAPIAILPNGVSPSWLQSGGDPLRFRRQHHLLRGERLMLYLSRLHPIKGLPLLVEALAMNRDRVDGWRLIVAGPDQGQHRAEIRSLAEQSGIAHLVVFTGALFNQEKRDAFAAAELFVLPTRSENFGIVIAEALAAGVPVLTTHGAPWSDVQDHRCGWWVPIEARAIAAALADAVAQSPDELRAMGDRGRILVRSRFVWPAIAERTLLVYRWLLGLAPTPDFVTVN